MRRKARQLPPGLLFILLFSMTSIARGQAVSTTAPTEAAKSPAVVLTEFLYEKTEYPQCHASTIVELSPGHLAAAWFGGTRERAPDVCIYFATQDNNTWVQKKVADGVQADGTRMPTWNPVLFQNPASKELYLFYKVGPAPSKWWGMFITSKDEGKTWSEPTRLPDTILGPVKNKPIILADGTWLSGSSTEGSGWRIHFERSTDTGKTWKLTGPEYGTEKPKINAIQPSVLTYPNGALQAVCRTSNGYLITSWSSDQGLTWSPIEPLDVPNPNSVTDAVTLKDGRQLLVYNNSAPPPDRPNKGLRYPLDVAISYDGTHWEHKLTLDSEPIFNGYSYPAVIQTSDGLVHITYTYARVKIKHVVIDPSKL